MRTISFILRGKAVRSLTALYDRLAAYMSYSFVQYAMITGTLTALVSSVFGTTLVMKRLSYIGDGLSHVAFGAMSIAVVMKIADRTALILPVTTLCAVMLLRSGRNARIKGDAATAMLSVGALALGYLVVNVFGASANVSGDVCSTLFGSTSILTLTRGQVFLCIILSSAAVMFFILFYNRLFAVTFDEDFAKAGGLNTEAYNIMTAVMISVIIVLAMNLVGALLITALIIFPAMSGMRLFGSFRKVTIFSAVMSVICALAGIIASVLVGTPVGSTIVIFDAAVFGICAAAGALTGGADT